MWANEVVYNALSCIRQSRWLKIFLGTITLICVPPSATQLPNPRLLSPLLFDTVLDSLQSDVAGRVVERL